MVLFQNLRLQKRVQVLLGLPLAFLILQATALYAQSALDSLGGFPDSASTPIPAPIPQKARALNAYFINVGQGDSEYIELPNGKNVLIDGGPANPSGSGAPLVAKFLAQRNVKHIDYLVLTHPHADHFTGLKYVADNLTVGKFYDTRIDNPDLSTLRSLRARIANKPETTVIYPATGEVLNWSSDVQVKVLNSCPDPASVPDGHVLNNCSIVVKVTYQNASILYAGDIEAEAEASLVARYGSELQADVLKAPHHGSPRSSTKVFLDHVKPKAAYIGVGNNTYGHPSAAAMGRLRAAGATIYRTDLEDTQVYTIKGY